MFMEPGALFTFYTLIGKFIGLPRWQVYGLKNIYNLLVNVICVVFELLFFFFLWRKFSLKRKVKITGNNLRIHVICEDFWKTRGVGFGTCFPPPLFNDCHCLNGEKSFCILLSWCEVQLTSKHLCLQSCAVKYVSYSHMWLLRTGNVARATEKYFHLFYCN